MNIEHVVNWSRVPEWALGVGFEFEPPHTMWLYGVNPAKSGVRDSLWWIANGNKCRNYEPDKFTVFHRPPAPGVDLIEQDIVWADIPSWIQRLVYRSDVPAPRIAAYGRRTYTKEAMWYIWPSLRPITRGPSPETFPGMKILLRPTPGLQSREEFAKERAVENGEEFQSIEDAVRADHRVRSEELQQRKKNWNWGIVPAWVEQVQFIFAPNSNTSDTLFWGAPAVVGFQPKQGYGWYFANYDSLTLSRRVEALIPDPRNEYLRRPGTKSRMQKLREQYPLRAVIDIDPLVKAAAQASDVLRTFGDVARQLWPAEECRPDFNGTSNHGHAPTAEDCKQPHVSALDIARAVYSDKESPYDENKTVINDEGLPEFARKSNAEVNQLYHYDIRNIDNGLNMSVECPAGYHELIEVLFSAIEQATVGKGRDRHARDLPFTEQPMQLLNDALDSADGALFQAMKKITESKGLDYEAKLRELRGAIVYTAGAIIWYQRHQK